MDKISGVTSSDRLTERVCVLLRLILVYLHGSNHAAAVKMSSRLLAFRWGNMLAMAPAPVTSSER